MKLEKTLEEKCSSGAHVLAIGLDGATFKLLGPWLEQGKLPHLRRLKDEGAWGNLESVVPSQTGPAFAALLTGKSPGNNGVYEFSYRVPGTYEQKMHTPSSIHGPLLWELLNGHSKRSALLFVPMTYPAPALDGVLVSGLPTPDYLRPDCAYPPDILDVVGANRKLLSRNIMVEHLARQPTKRMPLLLARLTEKGRIARELLGAEVWDLFVIHFQETDIASHALWRYVDPQSPLFDESDHARYGHLLLELFRHCDRIIAELVEAAGRNCIVMVFSDHGFGPCARRIQLDNWMAQEGFLTLRPLSTSDVVEYGFNKVGYRLHASERRWLRQLLSSVRLILLQGLEHMPQSLQCRLDTWVQRQLESRRSLRGRLLPPFQQRIDWKRTMAYPMGTRSAIYINLQGREPSGIVKPGADYEAVVETILERLRVATDHNGSLFPNPLRREQIYSGQFTGLAPDIIPLSDEGSSIAKMNTASRNIVDPPSWASGIHHKMGILIMSGPAVRTGWQIHSSTRLIDLLPTILALLRVPIPNNLDGEVLTEMLKEALTITQSHETQSDAKMAQVGGQELTEHEESAMIERLRELGYVE